MLVARDLRAKVTKSRLIDSGVIQVEKKTLYSFFGKIICEIRSICDGGRNALDPSVLKGECGLCNALLAPVLAWLCLSCPRASVSCTVDFRCSQIPKGRVKTLHMAVLSTAIVCKSEPCVEAVQRVRGRCCCFGTSDEVCPC